MVVCWLIFGAIHFGWEGNLTTVVELNWLMAGLGKPYLCGYHMLAMLRFWLVFFFLFFCHVSFTC